MNHNNNNPEFGFSLRLLKNWNWELIFTVSFYLSKKTMIDKNQLLLDLFQAYYDARRNKRNKVTALTFEMNYESKLLTLCDDLVQETYIVSPSICFIIKDPVQREVFAADFRDRIIHHLIYNYIYELFDSHFIYDSYSCRLEKWTHFGVQRIQHFIRSCSQDYTNTCWILKMDIQWFFMHIDKHTLFDKIKIFLSSKIENLTIDYEFLINLIHQVIFHDSTQNCVIKWKKSDWDWLPDDKSLFHSPKDTWLAIGNLTSQLFANIYLDSLDKFVVHDLWFNYYGRYVDDFLIVHQNKQKLLDIIPKIRDFLHERLHLTLHPKKIYLQDARKWVLFLGAYIKPYRTYIRKRTIGKFYSKIESINSKLSDKNFREQIRSVINSYLGLLSHHKSYAISRKIISKIDRRFRNIFTPVDYYKKINPLVRKLKLSEIRNLYPQWYYHGNLR